MTQLITSKHDSLNRSHALFSQWQALQTQQPKLRIRDAAQHLSVSEEELLATRCGKDVVRLASDWKTLLNGFAELGKVMILTRNEWAVHERVGEFANIEIYKKMALVANREIDLRIFLQNWHTAYAVCDQLTDKERHSIHIFDQYGMAVHKLYLLDDSNLSAYQALVNNNTAQQQQPWVEVIDQPNVEPSSTDINNIDLQSFRKQWSELKDTHHFSALLNKFTLQREHALNLIGKQWAEKIAVDQIQVLLEQAAKNKISIMVFVSNHGTIQIHTGNIERVKVIKQWLNILDADFSLHLNQSGLATAWLVRKPTSDGNVTSLEVFDSNGKMIIQLFGERKPGIAESIQWRELAESLVKINHA